MDIRLKNLLKFRIFWGIFSVAVAAMILASCGIMFISQHIIRSNSLNALESYTNSLASVINGRGRGAISREIIYPYRVTVIMPSGEVFFDSEASASQMDSHLQRLEVIEALQSGTGRSVRMSDTLSERTDYFALKLKDGSILRCSVTTATVFHGIAVLFGEALVILTIAAALSAFFARRISKRIVEPINELDLDRPLDADIYEELTPLIRRLDDQQRHITSQILHIKRQAEELSAVTSGMREGLVVLNASGEIISLNRSACKILHCSEEDVGKSFLKIDHSDYVREIFEGDHSDGPTIRNSIERDAKIFDVFISRVGNEELLGYAMIFVNVTAAKRAEMQRREFTANVSHELKTPLQSIIGAAELLSSGLVKRGDEQTFYSKISRESNALLRMINDIILLSRLDEGSAKEAEEELDPEKISREIAKNLSDKAATKHITISTEGQMSPFLGIYRYFYEMIFNLADNAVKYGKTDGHVRIMLSEDDNERRIEVEDDGNGIPKEDQGRIFERFYRVDKSHSRRNEGTGLGLSIVKRAAMFFGGNVSVKSEIGVGTSFKVVIPRSKNKA